MKKGVDFGDFVSKYLFREAITHSSTGENIHNERLEFLGDSVLGLVISQWLYENPSSFTEGRMSQIRAAVVKEESLAEIARDLDLGYYLRLGKGEEKTGGRSRPSLLADALEAVIAAMYLNSGLETTRNFILTAFADRLKQAVEGKFISDYKSEFQEKMQAKGQTDYLYKIVKDTGPDHNKTFWVELKVADKVVATATGKTKKQAEQEAARRALIDFNGGAW